VAKVRLSRHVGLFFFLFLFLFSPVDAGHEIVYLIDGMADTVGDELLNMNWFNGTKLAACFIVFAAMLVGGAILLPLMVCRYQSATALSRARLAAVQTEAAKLEGLPPPSATPDDPLWSRFVASVRIGNAATEGRDR
jgi:hypothetical protein